MRYSTKSRISQNLFRVIKILQEYSIKSWQPCCLFEWRNVWFGQISGGNFLEKSISGLGQTQGEEGLPAGRSQREIRARSDRGFNEFNQHSSNDLKDYFIFFLKFKNHNSIYEGLYTYAIYLCEEEKSKLKNRSAKKYFYQAEIDYPLLSINIFSGKEP